MIGVEQLLPAIAKGFGGILGKLAADHAARVLAPEKAEKIKTDIAPHLEATFRRCTQIKTLLTPNEPVDFLSIYATQRFKISNSRLDQYDLVEYIRSDLDNAIVTGLGGSGKSMFMRYLWLSLFVHSDGKIPLFVELRSLNSVSNPNLLSFLHHTLSGGSSSISQSSFSRHMRDGNFVIILDGFDEISSEKRNSIQSQILSIAEDYSSTKLILSSRPNDEFASWTSFTVAEFAPMNHDDTLELISKAPFDESVVEKFKKKVADKAFYSAHLSFLQNPLLASMMLLTFSYNYDIPDRMHLFYDQAFEALYQRHDKHKPGGFKRQFNCDLSEDKFKRLLSYFCLLTYYEQAFEFDRPTLTNYVANAISIEKLEIDPAAFVDDLTNSVCLIVKDGLTYSFAHRSFQEYFSAYCLAYVLTSDLGKIISRLSGRREDQAIAMLAEMNPGVFRDHYVLPLADKYKIPLQLNKKTKSLANFLKDMDLDLFVAWIRKGGIDPVFVLVATQERANFVRLISKLNSKKSVDLYPPESGKNKDRTFYNLVHPKIVNNRRMKEMIISGGDQFSFSYEYTNDKGEPDIHPLEIDGKKLNQSFKGTSIYNHVAATLNNTTSYIEVARAESANTTNAMAELFKI